MSKKLVVVVDMQNDFIDGVLGTAQAEKIVSRVAAKLKKAKYDGDTIVFTRDTHGADYSSTEEGKNLPIPHCLKGSEGWEISGELNPYVNEAQMINKETFGSRVLGEFAEQLLKEGKINSIELFGLCTDICVISNALLVKAFCPNIPVTVDASCCAGVSPEAHDNAIKAMESCQIHIINKGQEPWR